MKIEIFDVDHGQCIVITCHNGRRIMVDCGERRDGSRWWAPSMRYCSQDIDALAVLNLDEDHLENFPALMQHVRIGQIVSNPTIGAAELLAMKLQGMDKGVSAFHAWLGRPRSTVPLVDFGDVRVWWYCNPYIPNVCDDTNNLSVVLFVRFGNFQIVFGGDMEDSGWRQLMAFYPAIIEDLKRTNIFVASHHGRESGCCEELFHHFMPEIVIMSDGKKQYGTQETDDWYRNRCLGAAHVSDPSLKRYVLTTRNDGSMEINATAAGAWTLNPVEVTDWDLSPPVPSFGINDLMLGPPQNTGIANYGNLLEILNTPQPSSGIDGLLRALEPQGGIADRGSLASLLSDPSKGGGITDYYNALDLWKKR